MNKKTLVIMLLSALIVSCNNIRAQNMESVQYLDEMTLTFNELKKETWKYLKVVTRGRGARRVENKRQKLIQEIITVKSRISGNNLYGEDESLKVAIEHYLDISYSVLKEDYDKILDMEEIAEQSYDAMEAYLLAQEMAGEKLNTASDTVQLAVEEYAFIHDITLIDSEQDKMTQRIERASEALSYYNDVYLIFFKSYLQESRAMEAFQNNDIIAFEQNANALGSIAEEGLNKIDILKSFHGDANLKLVTKRLLNFYKNESEKDFRAMTDFFIAKDNFEKVQEKIESKREKDRTQQDIDLYNKAAEEYNKSIDNFNRILENNNNQRNHYLDQWNEQVERFFEVHTD